MKTRTKTLTRNRKYKKNTIKRKYKIGGSNYPSDLPKNMINNYKLHFLTYGDNKYKNSKKRIFQEALNSNFFYSINCWGPEHLDQDFKTKFKNILKLPRGGGYWIWRHHLIMKKMKEINTGEYLVFLDAGCTIDKSGKKRLIEYIDILHNSKYDILGFKLKDSCCIEKTYTTKQIFNYFNLSLDSNIANTSQIAGGLLIIRKGNNYHKYFDLFNKVINHDPYLITEKYNKEQASFFIDSRHDQSIFSIVRKILGSVTINDESYPPDSRNVPFKSSRIRG